MTLDDGQKVEVLIAALQERYQALRTIRDRVQSICVWALGLLVGASGWAIQTDETPTGAERMLFIFGMLAAVGVLRLVYLADLEKGFGAQQRTAVRLEKALGFYKSGVFGSHEDPIYPSTWADAGKDDGRGRFFTSSYALLYVGTLFFLLALTIRGATEPDVAHTPPAVPASQSPVGNP